MTSMLLVFCLCGAGEAAAAGILEAALDGASVRITVDGTLFACYKFAPDQKYPYFWPVNGPRSGASVTIFVSPPAASSSCLASSRFAERAQSFG